LLQGELQAAKIDCATCEMAAFRRALDDVRHFTSVANPTETVPSNQASCAAAGVATAFFPALPKTGVIGATLWSNPRKVVVQSSLRQKTNDHVRFTFFFLDIAELRRREFRFDHGSCYCWKTA
jgi:HTH-type transcriptional regulator / antitoxin HigA